MNTHLFISIILLAAATCLRQEARSLESPQAPDGTTVFRDVAYVTGGHARQKLDLYLPKAGTNLPLIIHVHGESDPAVPHHRSQLLDAALKQAGVTVTFYTVKGAGHGGFKDPKVPELKKQFFGRHLKP